MPDCVFLQVSASNAITFSSYVLLAAGEESTTWKLRGVAVASTTFAIFVGVPYFVFHLADRKLFAVFPRTAMFVNNVTGFVKIFMLLFVICTGESSQLSRPRLPRS
jgi:hypothetical protein